MAWTPWILVTLIAAITLLVFAPVRHFEFVSWDDGEYIGENAMVLRGLTADGVTWALTTGERFYWHPLTWLSHMADVELYGVNAGGHHVTSLVLHLASTLLLFGLLRRMTGSTGRSAFVAALFAVHPLRVESVAWVAERKDVLSAFFWMLTLWAYVGYARHGGRGRYLSVMLLYLAALAAKPMAVTLPFVLLLVDVWPLGRLPLGAAPPAAGGRVAPERQDGHAVTGRMQVLWRLVLEKLPLLAMAVAASGATILHQFQAGSMRNTEAFPLGLRAANAVVSYVNYIWSLVWPAGLSPFYPYPASIPAWQVAAALAAVVAATLAAWRAATRLPYLAVGWFWYLGTLLPVIGLFQVGDQARADRFTYLPHIGLFIAVAWGVPDLLTRWRHRRIVLPLASAIVVSACAVGASRYVHHWENSLALWTRAAAVTTNNLRAHANLGHEMELRQRVDEAIGHYAEATRINPRAGDLHGRLGTLLLQQGRTADAIERLSRAVQLRPDLKETYNTLGFALAREGRMEEAIAAYREAIRRAPENARAHNNLGMALADQGRLDEALGACREAARLDPQYAQAHNNVGVLLERQGRAEEAVAWYARAVAANPGYALAHANLQNALASVGRLDEAIRAGLEALRLEPGRAEWHYELARLFDRTGQTARAAEHLERALGLNPRFEPARAALAEMARR